MSSDALSSTVVTTILTTINSSITNTITNHNMSSDVISEDVFNVNTTENETGGNGTTSSYNEGTVYLYLIPAIPQWISTLYFTMLIMSIAIGIPGNALTAATYAYIKNKTNCDWYILFMALIDLVACVFRNTGYLAEYLGVWAYTTNSEYCKFVSWLSQTTVCISIFMFALIAVDRYTKLCLVSHLNITPIRSRNICIGLTMVNLGLASPNLYLYDNNYRGACTVKATLISNDWLVAYYTIIFVFFLIMMVAVVFCYVCIAIKVRQTRRVVAPTSSMPSGYSTGRGEDTDTANRPQHITTVVATTTTTFPDTRHTSTTDPPFTNHVYLGPAVGESNTDHGMPGGGVKRHTPVITGLQGNMSLSPNHPRTTISVQLHSPTLNPPSNMSSSNQQLSSNDSGAGLLNKIANQKALVRQQRNIRVTGLLFLVTTVFILSWIPPYVAMVKGLYIGYSFPMSLNELCLVSFAPNIYIINTFSNPIIYAALSGTYRKNVTAFFRGIKKSKSFGCCSG